jgi:hypothetical protein
MAVATSFPPPSGKGYATKFSNPILLYWTLSKQAYRQNKRSILTAPFYLCQHLYFLASSDSKALVLDSSVFQTPCDAGTIGSTSPYAANISDADYAVGLTRGLESGTGTGFSFINLTAGDTDFLAAGSNMTSYILNTYGALSHTRRAATTFEGPVNPVIAFSALLEAGEGTFLEGSPICPHDCILANLYRISASQCRPLMRVIQFLCTSLEPGSTIATTTLCRHQCT